MPTITQSVKFDDQHLQDLAGKARALGSKRGYLNKADPKQKKLHTRWCCVFQNFFFYFESESCTRPLGVIFLEGTQCKEVSSVAGQKEVSGAGGLVHVLQRCARYLMFALRLTGRIYSCHRQRCSKAVLFLS